MGRSGADSYPVDLDRLTPRERLVYRWAVRSWADGVYPCLRLICDVAGLKATASATRIRNSITRKVGWPCAIVRRRSGSQDLRPFQRKVLGAALDLWDNREYPSISAIQRILGISGSQNAIVQARRECVKKKMWPCRVKVLCFVSEEERRWILSARRSSLPVRDLPVLFMDRWGHRVSAVTVRRILNRAGLTKSYRPRQNLGDLDSRKAAVIRDRGGYCPRKIEDPPDGIRSVRSKL